MLLRSFIFESLRPFKFQILGLLGVSSYWAVHISLQPYLIKSILNATASTSISKRELIASLVSYIFIAIVFNVNFRIHDLLALKLYPRLKTNIIRHATERITHSSYGFFLNHLTGTLSSQIKELSHGICDFIQILVGKFYNIILSIIIACYTLFVIDPKLPIFLLVWSMLIIVIHLAAAKRTKQYSIQLSKANTNLIGLIVDRFSNLINVHLFSGFNHEANQLNKAIDVVLQDDKKLRSQVLKIIAIQGLLTTTMSGSLIAFLIVSENSHTFTVGDFGLVIVLTLSFSDILLHFAMEISRFAEVYGSVKQSLLILNSDGNIHSTFKTSKKRVSQSKLNVQQGEIIFDDVSFKYPNGNVLFQNLNVKMCAGEKIGIVGASGCGKTTFLSLILGLHSLDSGRILIDQQDIAMVQKQSIYDAISMITQEPVLFHRTIMDNIAYGNLLADTNEIVRAAKQSLAHDFITDLEHGYHTIVGERGINLSGGQKQRIALARIFLKNTPILLFDEATSALDLRTETKIKNNLRHYINSKTAIFVTHRISTLIDMDRIIVLESGKIAGQGSHMELLNSNVLYQSLWAAQSSDLTQPVLTPTVETDLILA